MTIEHHRYLTSDQKAELLKLWNEEYPQQLNCKSIDELNDYLSSLQKVSHFLIVDKDKKVLGWAFKFFRDSQKWFVVILSNTIQYKGWGTKILKKIVENENEINGWVVDKDCYTKSDCSVYRSPLGFYLKNGFSSLPEYRLELPNLSAIKIKYKRQKNI